LLSISFFKKIIQLCQYDKDLFAFYVDKYEDEASKYIKQIMNEIKEDL